MLRRSAATKLPAAKIDEPDVDHGLAAVAVGPPAERDLQDRLREAVSADRDADQRQVVAARQVLGVDREHRQDHEHAEHPQPENAREADARAQLDGAHAVAREITGTDVNRHENGGAKTLRNATGESGILQVCSVWPPSLLHPRSARVARACKSDAAEPPSAPAHGASSSASAARARTTSRTSSLDLPRNRLVVITGLLGLRQVVARVRHALRRRPAPLRRIAVGLRAPVPAAHGEARRRSDRRALAGDLDRAESDQPQSALDRRHRHRNPRLPAAALRAHRRPALPRARHPARGAKRLADGRSRAARCPRTRGS